jgi:radical SAM superfamily enzyme YgiQ (UPF0313 family)
MKKLIHPSSLLDDLSANELKDVSVTFINMPLRESATPVVAPEGPAILAAVLRKYGANVSILDLNSYRIKDKYSDSLGLHNGRHLTYSEAEYYLLSHLNKHGDQDLIAFSGIITTLRWQEEMAKIVRKYQPHSFIVSGNGLATEIKFGLFNWIPELDAIARSEGDDVILIIAKDVKNIKNHGLTNSICSNSLSPYYHGMYRGKHRFVYEGNRPKRLDNIPFPAWDLLESDCFGNNVLETYIESPIWGLAANNSSAAPFVMKRSLNTVSSRGCPYACAFCYRGAQGERQYGIRSANNIALQMKLYEEKYNLDFIGYVDDNFAVTKKRMRHLPEAFKEHNVLMRWGTHTRMDEADERIYPMSDAGCVYIGFGAESAHEETLKRMKKGGFILRNGLEETEVYGKKYMFPATMKNGIVNCHKAGIHANCTWIMGYPGETLEHLKTSVAFILWQQQIIERKEVPNNNEYTDVNSAINRQMFTATAYPGTAMFNEKTVRQKMTNNFQISFDEKGDPICDDNFHQYVLELDDATKVLSDNQGNPINYSEIPIDKFLLAREYIDSDQIEKILEIQ